MKIANGLLKILMMLAAKAAAVVGLLVTLSTLATPALAQGGMDSTNVPIYSGYVKQPLECPTGQYASGRVCVDFNTSAVNTCPAGMFPSGGSCVSVNQAVKSNETICPGGQVLSGGSCISVTSMIPSQSQQSYPWTHYFVGQSRTASNGLVGTVQSDGSIAVGYGYPNIATPVFNEKVTLVVQPCGSYGVDNFSASPLGIGVDNSIPTDWSFSYFSSTSGRRDCGSQR